jgi:mRNA interferase MazF
MHQFGDVYPANLKGGEHVQAGVRPVVIAQNNVGNLHSPTGEVIPMTSKAGKAAYLPTHVLVRQSAENHLTGDSLVLAEQATTVPAARRIRKIEHLETQDLTASGKARAIQSPFLLAA